MFSSPEGLKEGNCRQQPPLTCEFKTVNMVSGGSFHGGWHAAACPKPRRSLQTDIQESGVTQRRLLRKVPARYREREIHLAASWSYRGGIA